MNEGRVAKRRKRAGSSKARRINGARLGAWVALAILVPLLAVLGVSTWSRHVPRSSSAATVGGAELDPASFCIVIRNGNGRHGEASRAASMLRGRGFRVEDTLNADRFDYPHTLVVDCGGNAAHAGAVAEALGGVAVVRQRREFPCGVEVVLGEDWSSVDEWSK